MLLLAGAAAAAVLCIKSRQRESCVVRTKRGCRHGMSDSDEDGPAAPPPPPRRASNVVEADDSSDSDDPAPPPPPPNRKGPAADGAAASTDARLVRLSSRVQLHTPGQDGDVEVAPTNLAAATEDLPDNGRDLRLKKIIADLKAKLDGLWPQGIDPKTKLRWINSDATVATKASEVLDLPSNANVVQGEANRCDTCCLIDRLSLLPSPSLPPSLHACMRNRDRASPLTTAHPAVTTSKHIYVRQLKHPRAGAVSNCAVPRVSRAVDNCFLWYLSRLPRLPAHIHTTPHLSIRHHLRHRIRAVSAWSGPSAARTFSS